MAFALGPLARSHGYRLIAFDAIGSTNTDAMTRARAGDVARGRGPLWLVTSHQTQGRGRRSRPWETPPGNLAASVVEVMNVAPQLAATLGFAAGLALATALQDLVAPLTYAPRFRLKWPNDVLAGTAKLSGILLEAEALEHGNINASKEKQLIVVVGIGVNVVSAPQGLPYPATSLQELGLEATAEDVFAALSDAWTTFRDMWDEGRGLSDIRAAWLDHAAGLGEKISVKLGDKTLDGIFQSIDDDGRLLLDVDGRIVPIAAGDVHFGNIASAGAQ
jgi:BirA family transcriptional regulator, biotin operon repressor / biotin---[acetyl-CoA-carboxylase] ligase